MKHVLGLIAILKTVHGLGTFAFALALFVSIAASSNAGIIFSQDFESGLGSLESTSGQFSVNNTGFNAGLNSTKLMGHAAGYSNSSYSYYQISGLDLSAATGTILLDFNYYGIFETFWDRFNILVGTGAILPPAGLATTTGASQMKFKNLVNVVSPALGQFAYDSTSDAGGLSGVGEIDLTAFAGQLVNIRFQFASDSSVTNYGINIDNIVVTNRIAAVPEPATMTIWCLGGLAFSAVLRYRKSK